VTLTLQLPSEKEAALKAKAEAQGVSTEEYVQQVIDRDLDGEGRDFQPFWETFTRQMETLPDELFEHLPEDGASEHDHYLYGSPKKNS